jgi:arylsulfatase A-like enzyme/Flp pilus assembly protein TadD
MVALASCTAERRVSVLLVTLDTVRADYLGCYGRAGARTGSIDSLAARGVRFDAAYAQSPLTLPSHATVLTGLIPPRHGLRDNGAYVLSDEEVTLAEVLQQRGYHTGAFIGAFVLDSGFGLAQGFEVYDDELPAGRGTAVLEYAERGAGEVSGRAAVWLSRVKTPFFAWVHFFDPHRPYNPPAPYDAMFPGSPYQGEIAYVDAELGRLLDVLRRRELREECLVVVLSDHGEGLGQHGELTHGLFVYEPTMRVPLVMSGPGLPGGLVVASRVRLVDVVPTVLELLGIPWPGTPDGFSVLPLLLDGGEGYPSYGESFYPFVSLGWSPLRAVRAGRFTYIEAPTPELYDTAKDPQEAENLAGVLPDKLQEMAALLDSLAGPLNLGAPPAVSPDAARKLQALGYLSGGASKAPGDLRDPKDALPLYQNLRSAEVMIRAGRPARAESLLQSLLDEDRGNRHALLILGVLLREQNRLEEAAEVLERGCLLYPDDYELHLQAGICLRRLGRPADARVRYEQALAIFGGDATLHTSLGILEEGQGNSDAAAAAYAQALVLDPDDALAHFNLGMLLVRSEGDAGAALSHLDRAVALDPSLGRRPNVAAIRQALRRVAHRT